MKKIFFILFVISAGSTSAQQFISNGKIEFQVISNNHKAMGEGVFADMFKDQIPKLSTSYYQYTFNGDKSVYKFDRNDEKTKMNWGREKEDNIWYNDYSSGSFTNYKFIIDNYYLLAGKLKDVEWKISPNETRVIANFNCRKATGILFDSVYVFAFYTDEITISGGPMGLHGLPGMILGVTIPRMFTSWVATKLDVNSVNNSLITVPTKGKKKEPEELYKTVKEATKNWGDWATQQIWNMGL